MKTTCPKGHNIEVVGRASNGRCNHCIRDYARAYYRLNKEQQKRTSKAWKERQGEINLAAGLTKAGLPRIQKPTK